MEKHQSILKHPFLFRASSTWPGWPYKELVQGTLRDCHEDFLSLDDCHEVVIVFKLFYLAFPLTDRQPKYTY